MTSSPLGVPVATSPALSSGRRMSRSGTAPTSMGSPAGRWNPVSRCRCPCPTPRNRGRGMRSDTVGPCTKCGAPHERYGPAGRPLCAECSPGSAAATRQAAGHQAVIRTPKAEAPPGRARIRTRAFPVLKGPPMTEENAPDPYKCPDWCTDRNHAEREIANIRIHDSRGVITPDPSSVVMYAHQVIWQGKPEPAVVHVAATEVADGDHHARLELSADQTRALGLIVNDVAKSGMKGVRIWSKGLRELAAEIAEPGREWKRGADVRDPQRPAEGHRRRDQRTCRPHVCPSRGRTVLPGPQASPLRRWLPRLLHRSDQRHPGRGPGMNRKMMIDSNGTDFHGPGLFEINHADGSRSVTNVRRLAGAEREPGSMFIGAGTIMLGLLAAGLLYVSFSAQFTYIFAAKHQNVASIIQALCSMSAWSSSRCSASACPSRASPAVSSAR